MDSFFSKNPNSFIKYPPVLEEFDYILKLPIFLALTFTILSNASLNKEKNLLSFVFYILKSISKNQVLTCPKEIINIEAENLADLEEKLKNISFNSFLYARIKYHQNEPKSIISCLNELKPIGNIFLSEMKIQMDPNNDDNESQIKKEKIDMVKNIKESLMKRFNAVQEEF